MKILESWLFPRGYRTCERAEFSCVSCVEINSAMIISACLVERMFELLNISVLTLALKADCYFINANLLFIMQMYDNVGTL